MDKWICVTVTIFADCPQHNGCRMFYDDDQLDLHLDQTLSYPDGMKALREAEKLLGRSAELRVNQFDSTICYKTIHGYVNRG